MKPFWMVALVFPCGDSYPQMIGPAIASYAEACKIAKESAAHSEDCTVVILQSMARVVMPIDIIGMGSLGPCEPPSEAKLYEPLCDASLVALVGEWKCSPACSLRLSGSCHYPDRPRGNPAQPFAVPPPTGDEDNTVYVELRPGLSSRCDARKKRFDEWWKQVEPAIREILGFPSSDPE